MKQKTTVLQPLLMCVLCVFLLCFVVVNVAAADDVFITNVANEIKEEGGKALEAHKDFSNNLKKAITALNDSVAAIEAVEKDDVPQIKAEDPKGEIKKTFNELKAKINNSQNRLLILEKSSAIFLENDTIEVFEEQIKKIKQNVASVKKAMSAMSENNDGDIQKALDDAEKLTENVNDIWLYVKKSVDLQKEAAKNAVDATKEANENINEFVQKYEEGGKAKTLVEKLKDLKVREKLETALQTLKEIQSASTTVGGHVDKAIEKFKAVLPKIKELKKEFEIKQQIREEEKAAAQQRANEELLLTQKQQQQRQREQEEEERTTSNITNTRDMKGQLEDLITADGGVIVFSSFAVIILQILTTAVV